MAKEDSIQIMEIPMSIPVILTGWLLMLVISIINGAIRDKCYAKYTSELTAHQISTLSSLLLLGLFIWFYTTIFPPHSILNAAYLGSTWMLLTIGFETLFFHFVSRHSWSELLENYNISKGRIWILIPLWLVVAPLAFQAMRSQ